MKYIIIGLGNYGGVLARELTAMGHEVIGVDNDPSKVEAVKDQVSTSFVLDSTDEQSLSILPLRAVNVVIVAIGEAFGASIKSVALLKKCEVEHIYARALDPVHKSVLEAFNIDMILTPERDAARTLVQRLDLHVNVESLKIDREYCVVKFRVPKRLAGFKLGDIAIEKEFSLKIITVLKGKRKVNGVGATISERAVVELYDSKYELGADDYLVCYGKYKDFLSFCRSV